MGKRGVVLCIAMFLGIFLAVNSSWAWYIKTVEPSVEESGVYLVEIKDPQIITKKIQVILKLTPEFKAVFLRFFGVKNPQDLENLDRELITKSPPDVIKEIDKLIVEFRQLDEKIRKKLYQESMA